MTDEANRPVKALLSMDEIVSTLDELGQTGVTDLAEQIDRPQSVVHDYLSTLVQLGYVVKQNGTYRLSLRYLGLGGRVRNRIPLYEVAKPEIQRLANESSSELVTLGVEERGLCVALDVVWSSQSIKYETIPGMHFPMHYSALGKAILANYPDDRVESILEQHGLPARTEHSITDRETLLEELEDVREEGISFEREEYKPGMISMAAPIKDGQGSPIGGISVSGPAHRMRESDVEDELRNKLLSAVNIIELNYSAR